MRDLTETARKILIENSYTAVLCSEDKVYSSEQRGVKPLIDFLESGVDFSGFSAADKTVGLGAAHLYILLGVRSVYAVVASRAAVQLLSKNGISITCDNEVPYIINRKGDGPCPIESAVTGITDPHYALEAIKKTLEVLKEGK